MSFDGQTNSKCSCDHKKLALSAQQKSVLCKMIEQKKITLSANSEKLLCSLLEPKDFTESKDLACKDCECSLKHYAYNNSEQDMQEQLLDAISHHDIRIVTDLIEKRKLNPNYELNMKVPLCKAVCLAKTDLSIVDTLLAAGADPNIQNPADLMWNRRPLHSAACRGHRPLLEVRF